jgi:hypothetical protein
MKLREFLEWLSDWRFTANQYVLATNPLRLMTNNFIFQPDTCGYSLHVTYSLTRRWYVVYNWCWSSPARSLFRSEFHGIHDHISLSQIWDSPNLEDQVPVLCLYSPRNRVARLYLQALFPFSRLLRLPELRWKYSTRPPHGVASKDRIDSMELVICQPFSLTNLSPAEPVLLCQHYGT